MTLNEVSNSNIFTIPFLHTAFEKVKQYQLDLKSRHCAILKTKDKSVFIGYNSLKSHPTQAKFQKNEDCVFRHAEIDAIILALRQDKDLSESTMYVARAFKNNIAANSKPCKGCLQGLAHFNINLIYYTNGM